MKPRIIGSRSLYQAVREPTAPLPYGFNPKFAFSRQKVRDIKDASLASIGTGILGDERGGISANLELAPRGCPPSRASRSGVLCPCRQNLYRYDLRCRVQPGNQRAIANL